MTVWPGVDRSTPRSPSCHVGPKTGLPETVIQSHVSSVQSTSSLELPPLEPEPMHPATGAARPRSRIGEPRESTQLVRAADVPVAQRPENAGLRAAGPPPGGPRGAGG